MFDRLCRFVQVSVILAPFAVAVAEISLDYYFGDTLRSDQLMSCGNELMRQSCLERCGPIHVCLLGKCFCLRKEQEEPSDDASEEIEKRSEEVVWFNDFEDYTEMTPKLRPQLSIAPPKSALRHHITHFCPNLDVARQCIRQCVKVGKPAFCGKDHICYCGHKYDYPINDDKNANPADIYAEFKDMYEKYFGPRDVNSGKTRVNKSHSASDSDEESFEDDY